MVLPLSRAGLVVTTIFGLAFHVPSVFAAFTIPANDGFVTDVAGLLKRDQESALEAILQQYKTQTSNEIAIVILPDLGGSAIEDIGLEIGRKWGVGSKGKSNGILMLVGYAEHEVRFDVGYGLEGAVPDIVAQGIIEKDIVPAFRSGDYEGGITAAISSLQKHIGGEYTAERYTLQPTTSGVPGFIFFIGFLAFQWLVSVLGRTKSWWLGGVCGGIGGLVLAFLYAWWISIPIFILFGLFLDFVVSSNYYRRGPTSWWAGGGWGPGGGRGSGGFGGFGGGGFGGGGASGRW